MVVKFTKKKNNVNLNVNKSFAINQAKGNWIFYLDPDERVPMKLAEEILNKIETSHYSAYKISRRNHFIGHWLKYGSQYPDQQIRLFKKNKAFFPKKNIHEKLIVKGETGVLQNDMYHYPYKDINQFFRKFNFYTNVESDYLINDGIKPNLKNNLKYFFFKPFTRFFRRYIIKRGFLDGYHGYCFAMFDAFNIIVRYIKFIEKREPRK